VIHGWLAMSLKQMGGSVANDFVQLFDSDPSNRVNFSSVGWSTQVNTTTPFVGVIDMGQHLEQLQSGNVNVWVSDNTGVDWAMYTVTVATPKADAVGASVYLDGGSVRVDGSQAPVAFVQNGGPAASMLTLGPTGRLRINDDFVQASNGVLALEVNGAGPSQIGRLVVSDRAILGGELQLHSVGSFMPAIGASYEIISATGGFAGTKFATTVFADSQGSALWGLKYGGATVTAHVLSNSVLGDLNLDGVFDASDWSVYLSGAQTNLAGLTPAEAYARGDLNLDGFNNLVDMDLFIDAYDASHGVGAFAAMLAGVPEPNSSLLSVAGALFAGCLWRAR
jgi:hypothetical protein